MTNSVRNILGIETSCDDTSVAIVSADGFVYGCLSANQDLVHSPFGGVVPEIASRNHTLTLLPLIEELWRKTKLSWDGIDAIAVTSRPGLIGSLLVGVVSAKTLALLQNKILIGVNHLESHLLAPYLHDDKNPPPKGLAFPYIALAVSGGHTQLYMVKGFGEYQVLGRTVDDAAGEAFDKFAKLVGLGFPGGVQVDKLSVLGNKKAFAFPRTMTSQDNLNFSFSGLKSAAARMVESMSEADVLAKRNDMCASYQEAIVDTLIIKLDRAANEFSVDNIVITGGVSANSRLRERAQQWAGQNGKQLFIPPLCYCTDNAAMVGFAGLKAIERGVVSDQTLSASAANLAGDFHELVQ